VNVVGVSEIHSLCYTRAIWKVCGLATACHCYAKL